MLPGPVFTFEMITTARRGRFYAIRSLYAIVLLLILWMIHSAWSADYRTASCRSACCRGSAFPHSAGSRSGQEILVLILTPALVAGAIADEKRRKTLHYLLASQLTGPEIVLGKLLVRMLYVGVLLGVSFPVMSLLVLHGRRRPDAGPGVLRGTAEHRVVPGHAVDLGLDDRPPAARGAVRHVRAGAALADRAAGPQEWPVHRLVPGR